MRTANWRQSAADGYEGPKRYPDAVRIASAMAKSLPAGEARDRYAARLQAVQARMAAEKANPGG